MNEVSAPDNYRARSRHDRFFYDTEFSSLLYGTLVLCVSIFAETKIEREARHILNIRQLKRQKTNHDNRLVDSCLRRNDLNAKG